MDYAILRLPKDVGAMPLEGEFSPELIPEPWKSLSEARIDSYPWGGDYRPSCAARVGWNEKGIHVLMYAEEPEIRAEITRTGGAVCTDSCLEFFLSPDASSPRYVNCEVNPMAVMHIGLGRGRERRTVFSAVPEGFSPAHSEHRGRWWVVSYTIPAGFISEHFGVTLRPELPMRGNFYKCGDSARRHYALFKPYDTPHPDYHRPEQFADLILR